MTDEYEVEIDGEVFTVRRVKTSDDAADEELTEEQARLIARAYLLADGMFEKEELQTETHRLVNEEITEKIFREITENKVISEEIRKITAQRQLEVLKETAGDESFDISELPDFSYMKNYRRQIEDLSRYLQRDSRRYDGYFETY